MTTSTVKPPKSFWIVTILAILWNLMGVFSFIGHVMVINNPEAMQELPEMQQKMYESYPDWMTYVFGIATISGALASLLMSFRLKISHYMFLISLIGVLISTYHTFFMIDIVELGGTFGAVFPVILLAIAVFLLLYTLKAMRNKWLK